MLHHQLTQLRQGEEGQDVVVGRVEQIALAAAHLAYRDGALHPFLPGGSGGGHHPVVAVDGFVDGPQYGGDDRAQPLFDEVQPDVGAVSPLGAGAHLAPGVGVPVQFRADRARRVHRPRQGHGTGRDVCGVPLVTLVTRGQLQPSRAHPRTAFRSPEPPEGPGPTQRSRKGTPGAVGGAAGWAGWFSTARLPVPVLPAELGRSERVHGRDVARGDGESLPVDGHGLLVLVPGYVVEADVRPDHRVFEGLPVHPLVDGGAYPAPQSPGLWLANSSHLLYWVKYTSCLV